MALVLIRLISLYQWVLIFYALGSWFPNARNSRLYQWIVKLAQPYMSIFDQLIPSFGGISFNVIIALFVLQLVQRGIVQFFIWSLG